MLRALGSLLIVVSTVLAQDAQPARPRIMGIDHVAFRVSDAAAAQRFYGDLLGLAEHARGETPVSFAIGSRQSIVLEAGLGPDDEERLSHLAFATSDVQAMAAYLTSRGVEVHWREVPPHPRAIRVRDPDGHAVEFVEASWPPAVDARAAAPQALSDRLLHAGLIVGDEARAHTFYRDTLGFTEMWRGGRPEGVTQWVNMRVPDGTDYLEYMLTTSRPDRRQRGVMHHVCLRVADIQHAFEEAARRSAALQRPLTAAPQIGVNGRYQLNLYDPDGTRAELMEAFTVR